MPTAIAALAFVGAATLVGLLLASGAIQLPIGKVRPLSGLEAWAPLGLIPLAGAGAAFYFLRRRQPADCVRTFTATGVLFVGSLAAFLTGSFEPHKAPRALIDQSGAYQPQNEIRLGSLHYFQPSLVFYGRREVQKLTDIGDAVEFLSHPYPVYMFVPEALWERVRPKLPVPYREVTRRYDFLRNTGVVVLTNR
jgi:hypothetical protein